MFVGGGSLFWSSCIHFGWVHSSSRNKSQLRLTLSRYTVKTVTIFISTPDIWQSNAIWDHGEADVTLRFQPPRLRNRSSSPKLHRTFLSVPNPSPPISPHRPILLSLTQSDAPLNIPSPAMGPFIAHIPTSPSGCQRGIQ